MNGILSSIQQQLMTFNSVPIWPLVINLIIGLLLALIIRWHLRRFDDRDDTIEALYYINIVDSDKLSALTQALHEAFPGVAVSFLDQKNVSGFQLMDASAQIAIDAFDVSQPREAVSEIPDARIETKFISPEIVASHIRGWLQSHSLLFEKAYPDRCNSNIYFDTPNLDAYDENLHRSLCRGK